jgi:hypothetical protein
VPEYPPFYSSFLIIIIIIVCACVLPGIFLFLLLPRLDQAQL